MKERPAKKFKSVDDKSVDDEMEKLVMGIPPKPIRKTVVRYDAMYGRNIKHVPESDNTLNQKFAQEQIDLDNSPNADYGGVKNFEEKYDGPDWREIVKKGELYSKMEKLEEKHGYEWSYN